MPDKKHLVDGMHFHGVLPHLKRERGSYFVTFQQIVSVPVPRTGGETPQLAGADACATTNLKLKE